MLYSLILVVQNLIFFGLLLNEFTEVQVAAMSVVEFILTIAIFAGAILICTYQKDKDDIKERKKYVIAFIIFTCCEIVGIISYFSVMVSLPDRIQGEFRDKIMADYTIGLIMSILKLILRIWFFLTARRFAAQINGGES